MSENSKDVQKSSLGLTAMPFSRGLGEYLDTLVTTTKSITELIKDGYLSEY